MGCLMCKEDSRTEKGIWFAMFKVIDQLQVGSLTSWGHFFQALNFLSQLCRTKMEPGMLVWYLLPDINIWWPAIIRSTNPTMLGWLNEDGM